MTWDKDIEITAAAVMDQIKADFGRALAFDNTPWWEGKSANEVYERMMGHKADEIGMAVEWKDNHTILVTTSPVLTNIVCNIGIIDDNPEEPMPTEKPKWDVDQILLEAKICIDRERKRPGASGSITTSRYDKGAQGTMRVPAALVVELIAGPGDYDDSKVSHRVRAPAKPWRDLAIERHSTIIKLRDKLAANEHISNELAKKQTYSIATGKCHNCGTKMNTTDGGFIDCVNCAAKVHTAFDATSDPLSAQLRDIVGRMDQAEHYRAQQQAKRHRGSKYGEMAALALSLRDEKGETKDIFAEKMANRPVTYTATCGRCGAKQTALEPYDIQCCGNIWQPGIDSPL
jgi:hypothetical protein